MNETIIEIVAESAVEVLFPLVLLVLATLGGWVLQRLGVLIGEKQTQALRDTLAPAVERAIARAKDRGLTGEALQESAASYLRQTMAETLAKLGASDEQLRQRIGAEEKAVKPASPKP